MKITITTHNPITETVLKDVLKSLRMVCRDVYIEEGPTEGDIHRLIYALSKLEYGTIGYETVFNKLCDTAEAFGIPMNELEASPDSGKMSGEDTVNFITDYIDNTL